MSIQQVSPKIYLNNITVKNKTLIIFLFDNSFFTFDLTKAVLADRMHDRMAVFDLDRHGLIIKSHHNCSTVCSRDLELILIKEAR